MNIQANTQVLYFFYSKFSPSSAQILPTVTGLKQFYNIHFISIDDPITREKVLKAKIKTVPCLLIQTASSLNTYEGQNLVDVIPMLFKIGQQQQQQQQHQQMQPKINPNGQTMLFPPPPAAAVGQTIVPPQQQMPAAPVPHSQESNFNSAVNARLQPIPINTAAPNQPIVTNQVAQQTSIQTQVGQQPQLQAPHPAQLAQMQAQQQPMGTTALTMQPSNVDPNAPLNIAVGQTQGQPPAQNPTDTTTNATTTTGASVIQQAAQMANDAALLQQSFGTQQQPSQPPPMQLGDISSGMILDDTGLIGGSTFSPDGAYTADMITGGTSMSRVDVERTSQTRNTAEAMMRDREQSDLAMNPQRGRV
jgi:hypothetical protein